MRRKLFLADQVPGPEQEEINSRSTKSYLYISKRAFTYWHLSGEYRIGI